MATVYGVNATLTNSPKHQNILPADINGSRLRWMTDSYECATTASGTDIVLGGKIPANAQILPGSKLYHDDLGTGTMTIGTTVSGVDLAADTNVGASAGSIVLNNTVDLFGTKTSAAVNVHCTPHFAGTATGTIRVSILYAMT